MTRRGLVLFALMSVIWGIPYLFIRIAVAEIQPAVLVLVRTALGAAILLPIALTRFDIRPVLARWRWVVAFALVEIAIPWVMLGTAEQHLSSSLSGLLVAGVPLVGAVIAIVSGGADRFGRTAVVGLLIGLVGVLAIVGADFQTSDSTALLEMGVVVVGYALGPAILARRLAGVPSVGIMALSLALSALIYVPIAAAQWPATPPSVKVIAVIIVLGVVCTALAFILFAALIAEVGPVRATVITYVNPAVAAILGVVVLSESFSPAMAVGFALVILGSTLATRPARPTAVAERPTGAVRGHPPPGARLSRARMAPGDTARLYHRLTSYSYVPPGVWPTPVDDPRVLQDFVPNDFSRWPAPCKVYPPGLPVVELPRTWPAVDTPTTVVLAGRSPAAPGRLDLPTLARLLHLSAGVVRVWQYGSAAPPVPCGGIGRRTLPARALRRGARCRRPGRRRALVRPGRTTRCVQVGPAAGGERHDARRDRRPLAHRLALLRARLPPHLLGRRHDAGADARAGGLGGLGPAAVDALPGRRGDAASSAPTASTSSRSRS